MLSHTDDLGLKQQAWEDRAEESEEGDEGEDDGDYEAGDEGEEEVWACPHRHQTASGQEYRHAKRHPLTGCSSAGSRKAS